MKIIVKAKPGAKEARVQELTGGLFESDVRHVSVFVREVAEKGRANRAIEKAIAEHFGVAQARVRIVSGETSRRKIVEIVEP